MPWPCGTGEGRHDGAIFVFHDLTRLRQLETLRQEFVANVSHELRTPLSLIKSAVETLIDGAKNDPATLARFLEIIDRHASRLTLLIDDLLLLSTLDSGRIRLQPEALSLRAAVQEVMDDYQGRATCRRVKLINEVPGALLAQADPDRLRQVLSNLVDNAIKYGREDGRVCTRAEAIAPGLLEVGVADDGPGIPPEVAGPDLRAVLPRRQGPLPRAGRHGAGPGHRQARGAGARRRRAGGERPGVRHDVLLHAPAGDLLTRGSRGGVHSTACSRRLMA